MKFSLNNGELAISFNGGKDCTVVLYLILFAISKQVMKSLKISNENIDIFKNEIYYATICKLSKVIPIYFPKKNEFPEISEFINHISKIFSMNIKTYPIENSSMCQELIKIISESNIKAIFMGVTANDNHETKIFEMTTGKYPMMLRVNPMTEWNFGDVWKFFKDYKCLYCSLYDKGYTSIGTVDNTIPNPALLVEATGEYLPAYMLMDENKERDGRIVKPKIETKL